MVATYIEKVSLNSNDVPSEDGISFYDSNEEVKKLNTEGTSFEINDAQISYSAAVVVGMLSNGVEFEVLMSQFNFEENFSAEFFNMINIDFGNESDLLELEGLV